MLKFKSLSLIIKIIITITSLLLFLAWLMFNDNNFYAKSINSIVNKIMAVGIQTMIWPCTFIILFIFIMPIWVTNNKFILCGFLFLALFLTILCFSFIFILNINGYWYYFLAVHLLNIIVFSSVIILYLIDQITNAKLINNYQKILSKNK